MHGIGSVRVRVLALAGLVVVLGLASTAGESAAQSTSADGGSAVVGGDNRDELRGIERDQKDGNRALETTGNVLLFLPRTLLNGLLYATVYGGQLIDDSNVVASVEDVFYLKGRVLGWYPLLTAGSGPAIGVTVFYRTNALGITAGGAYGSSDRWGAKVSARYTFTTGSTAWELQAAGQILDRDDYEFYGFGSDPQDDPRNQFLPGASEEFIVYAQQLTRLPVTLGVRPSSDWQAFYTFYYQERRLGIPGAENSNIFNPGTIPGIDPGAETTEEQIYNEIAVRFDSRERRAQISPGVRVEGYGGMATGTGGYEARFLRAGLDASFYVPIIRHDRIIVPRVVFDMIDSQEDGAPISFADFPRQPTFRGVSPTTLLRTDKYSMVPSLEYQWPLTYNLNGSVFVDYLLVSRSLDQFTFADAPYAYGVDIGLHSEESEIARLTLSSGSEGFRFLFTLGLPQRVSDRKKWQ